MAWKMKQLRQWLPSGQGLRRYQSCAPDAVGAGSKQVDFRAWDHAEWKGEWKGPHWRGGAVYCTGLG